MASNYNIIAFQNMIVYRYGNQLLVLSFSKALLRRRLDFYLTLTPIVSVENGCLFTFFDSCDFCSDKSWNSADIN